MGAEAVIVRTEEDDGFKLKPDALRAALSDRTRAVILNTPCNPTGAVYSAEDLAALAEVLAETDAIVIFDEIYSKLTFGGRTHANLVAVAPQLRAQTVIVNGASKAFAMTGWRIGLVAGPEELISVLGRFQSQTTSNPTTIYQYACLQALTGPQESVEEMRKTYEERAYHLHELLTGIPGITCNQPEGAFYLFPNVSAYLGKTVARRTITGSLDLAGVLLEEAKVATVAGVAFGDDQHHRLSCVVDLPVLEEAVARMKELFAQAE